VRRMAELVARIDGVSFLYYFYLTCSDVHFMALQRPFQFT
jgi:hypothetical protein